METKSATTIPVSTFRQILLWPLLLHHDKETQDTEFLKTITTQLQSSGWFWPAEENSKDKCARRPAKTYTGGYQAEEDYSEIVYFHSYVRDFLYGGDGEEAECRPLRVFTRDDVRFLKLTLANGQSHALDVKRAQAYLFKMRVLVVVVEVELNDKDFRLKDALDLQNVLRMVFPRRWNKEGKPSEAPSSAEWLDKDSQPIPEGQQDYTTRGDFTDIVRTHAELPAAKHWQYLVKPFPIYDGAHDGYSVKQIVDQRIPSMTYLAVPEPRAITDWDYARLAFFDSSGESSVGSYSETFLKQMDWEKKYAYDRFWQSEPSKGGQEVGEHNLMMRTRWLCSGYGLVVVGAEADTFFKGQLAANFRHHYFCMGLIVHFHRAAILMFRDRLAEASQSSGADFHKKVLAIQKEMNEFRNRFWFQEVSTQLQGQEFFTWWSGLLGNQRLFDEVTKDIEAAEALVRTEQQDIEAHLIKRLTVIGGAVGIVGLLLSAASIVIALMALKDATDKKLAISHGSPDEVEGLRLWQLGWIGGTVLLLTLVFCLVIGIVIWWVSKPSQRHTNTCKK